MNIRRILAGTVLAILAVQTALIAVPQSAWQSVVPSAYAATFTATLAKTGAATAAPGETIFYTVTVTNTGTVQENAISLSQAIPSGLTFFAAGGTAGCTLSGGTVVCAPQTFAIAQTVTYTLAFTVSSTAACNSQIDHSVDVRQSNITFATTNHVLTQVVCAATGADLVITNTPAPTSIERGGNVTFTLLVHNNGPSAATSVVITEALLGGLQFISSANATCTVNGTTVTCPIGDLASGADKSIQIVASTPADANCTGPTSGTNTATVASATADSVSGNNQSQATYTLTCATPQQADISVQNVAPTTIQRGNNLTYTITVNNAGPSPALNVVMREPVPSGLTFVSSADGITCVLIDNNLQISCPVGTMAANTSKIFHVTFSVPVIENCQASQVYSTAYVYTTTTDPTSTNDLSAANTTLTCPVADIGISITAASSTVNGSRITYTLTATNNGPSTAEEVHIKHVVPSQLTYVSTDDALCHVQSSTTVDCGYGYTIAAGQSKTVSITYQLTQLASCTPYSVATQASVLTTAANDTNAANNAASSTTNVTCATQTSGADLSITKTASPTSVVRGQNVTFTLTVTNNGLTAATNVLVRDPLQGGLTYVSSTISTGGTCQLSGTDVNCTLASLAAGATATMQIVAQAPVQQACSSNAIIYNTAYVSNDVADPNAANNQSQITVTLTCTTTTGTIDVSIQKIAEPAYVNRGDQMTFMMIVRNLGTATATNVVVTDPLPAGLTYVSSTGATCSLAGTTVTCTVGSVAPTDVKYVYITVQTQAQSQCTGQLLTNTATVTASGDINQSNNQSQANVTLVCSGMRFTITKAGPATAVRGDILTYTITVTNIGTAADNIRLVDNVPANTVFVSESSSHGCVYDANNNGVFCQPESYASGNVKIFTLKFRVLDTTPCNAIIENYADIQLGTDSFLWSNYVRTQMSCSTTDLSIVKTGPSSSTAGSNIVYTMSVTNNGPGTASGVVVQDIVPTGLTYVSASGATCTLNGSSIQCPLGTMTVGQIKTFTLTFSIPLPSLCSQSTIQNTATVQSAVTDANSSNNSSVATTTVTCLTTSTNADVSITKSGPSNVTLGQQISYTLIVTNSGPGVANSVTVTDPFNTSQLQYSTSSISPSTGASCSLVNSQLQCTLGTLNAGESRTITLTFSMTASVVACSSISNVASVSTTSVDSNFSNNQSQTISTQVQCNNNPPPPPQPPVTYTQQPLIVYQMQYQNQNQTQPAPVADINYANVIMPQTGSEDSFYAPIADDNAFIRPYKNADASGGLGMTSIFTLLGTLGTAAVGALRATRFFL